MARPDPPVYEAEILLQTDEPALEHLPEGPYPCGSARLSWVAIQHGPDAVQGSLNILDLATRENRSFRMPGRPGFAFPTGDDGVFLVGCEKRVGFYRLETGEWCGPSISVETEVGGTILNDGLIHQDAVIFGTKDLGFEVPRGGLYFWRPRDGRFGRLADHQICSNGKVILGEGERVSLLDIDTPTRRVVSYPLDLSTGTAQPPRTVLDLSAEPGYPDGMIATPDGSSVIIALYNPDDPRHGEARQYALDTGAVEARWLTPGSPRVTCPQWARVGIRTRLVLTTAVEGMPARRLRRHPNAGALFHAPAHGKAGSPPPPFPLPPGV
jgi:sugar lactone lactonase YvrE